MQSCSLASLLIPLILHQISSITFGILFQISSAVSKNDYWVFFFFLSVLKCFPMHEEQKNHQLFRKWYFIYCKVPETVNTLSEVQWTGTISLKCWTPFQEHHLEYSWEILSHEITWCKAHLPPCPLPAPPAENGQLIFICISHLTALKIHLVDCKLEFNLSYLGTLKWIM